MAFRKLSALFSKGHTLKQAVGILFVTVLISNVLGLLRNVIIANRVGLTYGSIAPLDNYYAAFVLPDLLYNIIIVGALSSAILPLLVKIDTEGDERNFWKTFNTILSTGLVLVSLGLVLLYFVMPLVIPSLFPGFNADETSVTIALAQVLLLSPLFFTISQISTSALQAKRYFFAPAVAPIIYNLAIIAGAMLIPEFGLAALVLGVICGAIGHFLVQLPSLARLGWQFNFQASFRDSRIRQILTLMIPRTIALASTQLLIIAFYRIASEFSGGSISIYKLIDDLQTAPVLLLANTLAMAILPDFARHFAKSEHGEFSRLIAQAIRLLLYVFLPVTIFLLIFQAPIVNLYIALGHAITAGETDLAIRTFRYFVMSLFFQGSVLVLARAYFARSDTYRPTLFSVISIVIAWVLAKIFAATTDLGVTGLALAFSIGSIINALLLWFNIGLPLGSIWRDGEKRNNIGWLIGGNIAAGIFFYLGYSALRSLFDSTQLAAGVENLLTVLIGLALGLVIYISWGKVFNLEQWRILTGKISSTEK